MRGVGALIGIVGRGDGPGIAVRVETYPMGDPDVTSDRRLADVKSRIAGRWAVLDSTYHPPADNGYTLKISRHFDNSLSPWTWVGLYQSVAFSEKSRGGFYFGAGLAFEEFSATDEVVPLVNNLFGLVMKDLFTDDSMSGSIFSLDVAGLKLKPLGPGTSLPAGLGLDPRAERGRFSCLPNFETGTIEAEVRKALRSTEYGGYSTLYLTNWADPRISDDFHVKVVIPSEDEQRLARAISGPSRDNPDNEAEPSDHRRSVELSSQELEYPNFDNRTIANRDDEIILRKITEVLRRTSNIENQLIRLLDQRQAEDDPRSKKQKSEPSSLMEFAFIAAGVIAVLLIIVVVIQWRGGFG